MKKEQRAMTQRQRRQSEEVEESKEPIDDERFEAMVNCERSEKDESITIVGGR